MGFVARVLGKKKQNLMIIKLVEMLWSLDLIFLFGTIDVTFSVALVLLGAHKELLKHQQSFENINEFLKIDLPAMSIIQLERIFNEVLLFVFYS